MEALSVYHARSLGGYRQTQDIPAGSATTEQLREAMIRCRALFEDLAGLRAGPGQSGRDRVTQIRGSGDQDMAANGGRVVGNGDRIAANGDRISDESDLAAENRDLAPENIDRTADRPR